jgi:hypothetical protein
MQCDRMKVFLFIYKLLSTKVLEQAAFRQCRLNHGMFHAVLMIKMFDWIRTAFLKMFDTEREPTNLLSAWQKRSIGVDHCPMESFDMKTGSIYQLPPHGGSKHFQKHVSRD